MVAAVDSTLVAIRKMVRRLTGLHDPSQLSDDDIDRKINTVYTQDFPSSCKVDQLRVDYEFFTEPYIDRYTVDLNVYQGFRSPLYVEGREGILFKDRGIFFSQWPKQTTRYDVDTGDGATVAFTFTITDSPVMRNSVTIGSVDTGGDAIKITDDGSGNLVEGTTVRGTIDYVTSDVTITFNIPPDLGEEIVVWANPYTPSRPVDVLFWNDEFVLRPVPDGIYRVEVEAYQSPTNFSSTGEAPILNQWWQFFGYGAAIKVLQENQDMEGLENILPWFEEQKGLILERQAIDGIGVKTGTIYSGYSDSQPGYQWGNW